MSWNQISTEHFVNGMIFVCDSSTYDEIFQHQMFGLPISYIREMKNLVPYRSALFLLEKHTNLLKGVFVPTCKAKKNIKDDIWVADGKESQFPAQIRFTLYCTMPSIPKESWHLPSFIRLGKMKAKFLDSSRVQMLLQAFQKYEMSNRMLIEQTFQQNIRKQYITTTILPPLRGDPSRHHGRSVPAPYRPPPLPSMHAHVHTPPLSSTTPSVYMRNEIDNRDPLSNEINEELITALKMEIDLLRVENAYMRTKGHNAYPGDGDFFGRYGHEEIIPHQPPTHHGYSSHSPSVHHEMKMINNSLSIGQDYYHHDV